MRHDVVVWGATGFTGMLVSEYLTRTVGFGGSVRWAIAGRSDSKLAAVRDRLATIDPAARDVPMIRADAADPDSLRALAAQATVVCTTVGPYAQYGKDLVAACVSEGAHYCDLTGEVHFIREMIDAHHEAARAKRVRIVHCCGFDSIPSDLGTWLVQKKARELHGKALPDVRTYVRTMKGGYSGGSAASMAGIMEASSEKATRRVLGDPYSLLPAGAPPGPEVRDAAPPRWDAEESSWISPFIMASTNGKMVRRSGALLGYGPDFRYQEVSSFGSGPRGWFRANASALQLGTLVAVMSQPAGRRMVVRWVPPGDGPSPEEQAKGKFTFHAVGRGPGVPEIRVECKGDKDPGYGATAGMLGESALCLALDGDALPDHHGVLTPASAMGDALVARLPRAGVTFEVL